MSTPSILEKIVATKRGEVEARRAGKTRAALELDIAGLDKPRDFHAALRERAAAGRPAVIAEFKAPPAQSQQPPAGRTRWNLECHRS